MNRFLLALQFLTILPFKIRGKIKDEDLGRSLLYFPVVGLLLGLFLSCVAYISASLPPLVAGALILAAWVWITGGIHLDGFADTCDGFYGNRPKEDILKIMRDSRIGTMGAAGIVIILIFKFAALASIHPENMWKILTASTVFGRWSQELACFASVYARDEGKAKHFIGRAKAADILIGAVFTLAVFWLTMGIKGAIVFISSSAAVLLFTWYVKKKIGGMTGDTIGAANEIAETAVLLFALA